MANYPQVTCARTPHCVWTRTQAGKRLLRALCLREGEGLRLKGKKVGVCWTSPFASSCDLLLLTLQPCILELATACLVSIETSPSQGFSSQRQPPPLLSTDAGLRMQRGDLRDQGLVCCFHDFCLGLSDWRSLSLEEVKHLFHLGLK